jgi:acyl-CoA reductase-like NAD-dependent aldehyde dehydrogenase
MPDHARHWIDGELADGGDGQSASTHNPADGSEVGRYADGGACEAKSAISAARRAFDAPRWAHDLRLRATVLLEMADALLQAREKLARVLTAENGKPLREADLEVIAAVSELRFYAGLARANFGRVLETEPGHLSMMMRESMGVAAIIVPWNAPIILLIRSLAPALAAGCTAVIKNAPQTAITNAMVCEAFARCASLPKGVINSFAESGNAGAQALVSSPDVDVVSYTGSTHVGKLIMQAASGTLKRLNLELGGSAPCIVFADADLDCAVPALVRAGMIMAGQQCVAASRLIVHESIGGAFIERMRAALAALVVGRGDDPRTQMGPLIDHRSRDRVEALVASVRGTATVHLDGRRPQGGLAKGAFLSPSLIEVPDSAAPILHQEIFGPVLTLQTFGSEAEAIARANNSRFGLAASVWTRDLQRAQRVSRHIRSGTVWLNMHGRLLPEVETGGYRESGIGRLHGVQGLEEFLQTKHVAWELGTV